MNGTDIHNSFRLAIHDQGLAYIPPQPEWSDAEITLRLNAARDVFYTRLVDAGAVVAVNNLIKTCTATNGTPVPADFWRGIMGVRNLNTATSTYILFQDLSLSLAMAASGLDTVYVTGGVFHGTATTAFYYARPQDDFRTVAEGNVGQAAFTEFTNGAMNAIMLLAVIELTMGEAQDAADRLDDLYELYQPMEATFE